MAKRKKTRSKIPAVVTYCIAVLALVAGLVLPMDNPSASFSTMPLMQITGALVALGVLKKLPFGSTLSPAYSAQIVIFGTNVNIGAILLLAYACTTLLALVLLIPVFAASRKRQTARKVAMFAEILALIVLTAPVAHELAIHTTGWNLNVFIPFGITLLMLILQGVIYFGGSGLIKTVMFVLSGTAVLFAICNVAANISALANPLNNLIAALKGPRPFETTAGLYALDGTVYYGYSMLIGLMTNPSSLIAEGSAAITAVNLIALALSIVVCVNMFFDLLGLGKRTKKFMLTANLIRYIIEFVLLLALMIAVFALGGNFGLFAYALFIIVVLQLLITLFRILAYRRKKMRASKAAEERDEDADIADSDDEYAFEHSRVPYTTATGSRALEDDRSSAYRAGSHYSGPADSFIRKLSSDEKIEFAKIFIERRVGNLSGIPEYVVGGDNTRFFSAVFIYFARVRDLVSDGLMNKLYEEVNLLH